MALRRLRARRRARPRTGTPTPRRGRRPRTPGRRGRALAAHRRGGPLLRTLRLRSGAPQDLTFPGWRALAPAELTGVGADGSGRRQNARPALLTASYRRDGAAV